MPLDNLPFANITELAEAYKAKKVSPVEVTQLMLDRIAKYDGRLNSFLTVTADLALAQARLAEAEIASGQWRGPMHGVPVGIKDLCETKGVLTTWGTTIFADHVPTEDCTVVKNLYKGGAVMVGKLHMTEGAYALHHPSLKVPVSPWNAAHWTGVSSSGSGVATAAGLCFGAIGTDTGGSIRFPSGANGLTGIKPTWGRVSRHGVLPLADSLDHVGPMTRSAADAGAMLGAMAGVDPADPTTLEAAVPDYLAGIDAGIRGLRIGFDASYIYDVCEADTAGVIDEVRKVLADLGAQVLEVTMPPSTKVMVEDWAKVCGAETAIAHEKWYPARAAEYGPALAGVIEIGRQLSAIELMKVEHARLQFKGGLRKLFDTVDLLLVPVHPFGNPSTERLEQLLSTPEGLNAALRFTGPFDLSGSPTITLPGGFTAGGLPIGFQLVGRHLDEPLLVRAGHAYQKVTDWHLRHPAL